MLNRLTVRIRKLIQRHRTIFYTGAISSAYLTEDLVSRRKQYAALKNTKKTYNPVYVFVWSSSFSSPEFSQGESIGHMSLQFEQQYVSFWPRATGYSDIFPGVFVGMQAEFSNTLQQDINIEKKLPSEILLIEGLDIARIEKKCRAYWQANSQNNLQFHLLYNFPFLSLSKKQHHTCTSLINELLITGGLPVKRFRIAPWSTLPLTQSFFYQAIGVKKMNQSETQALLEKLTNNPPLATQKR